MYNFLKKHLFCFLCVLFASLVMSFNIKTFVNAVGLIPSGFNGLSLLLQRTFYQFFEINIPYFIINISLNVFPALIGFYFIGKKFTGYSILMIIFNSFLVDIIPSTPITYDSLLVSVFGGIMNGIAIVIALYGGASSGGTDFVAIYLSYKLKKPSWNFIFIFNMLILIIAGFLFGFEAAMYSIIFQFVSTQIIEKFHQKDHKITLIIITQKPNLLSQKLMEQTHHGVTLIQGEGCYSHEQKTILYTVIGADEVRHVSHLCKKLDSSVFINIICSKDIKGQFYQKPLE